jgi:hypothetical protein
MKRNTRLHNAALTGLLAISLVLPASAQEGLAPKEDFPVKKPEYSPYVDQHFPNRVLWGDTHLHTILSMDDGFLGTKLGPEEAFRFARGEEVTSNTGQRARLNRPLDFLAVTDHAEYLGIADLVLKSDPDLLATETGRRWHDMVKAGGDEGLKAVWEVTIASIEGIDYLKNDKIKRSVWERVIDAASKYYEPGRFTTFNGFEWTSFPGFNNLHRVVLFRDGPERVKQVLPFSAMDSRDPEDLWKYMAKYEEKTGGQVLAIPHNGNMSNGRMFEGQTYLGQALTRAYAEERMRREPLIEVTQTKGDGETHPFLSNTDEFANFERWDFGNFGNPSVPKTKEMLQTEYARSALKLGLQWHENLGANPFKFGMIGSTDSHTALSSSEEDNFFGKLPQDEPSPQRWEHAFVFGEGGKPVAGGYMEQAAGLAAVWSRENTREAIFDSTMRKEVYATTGTRMIVRVFAGWDFQADEIERPDFAAQGYQRGVPMGGDLKSAPAGKAPTFMVRTLRDPDGANLDRIQIIKGWLDKDGQTHERIYDVAVSGGRGIDADGRSRTPVGNTVDVANAAYRNTIGAPLLSAYWKDPEFDPQQRAFYYVRVIEIPTPRWTAHDQKRFGIKMSDNVPMIVTERAYASPIWYTP